MERIDVDEGLPVIALTNKVNAGLVLVGLPGDLDELAAHFDAQGGRSEGA